MIARVSLDIALRQEFDYRVPEEFQGAVEAGVRVKVPLGNREVLGYVTALVEESPHAKLKPISQVIGAVSLVTPAVMKLARWIAGYYCCPFEIALKSVLPVSVRREQAGWKELLFVHSLPETGDRSGLTQRQEEILEIVEEWRELPMQELIKLAGTTAQTLRRLEDKGFVSIGLKISERDPYAREHILPTDPLTLNEEQAQALSAILETMDTPPDSGGEGASASTTFLLHGVTGSGKTEIYLQAIAHALEQGKGAIVLVPEISLTPQTVERFKARFNHGPQQTLVAVLHSHLSDGERHDEWHKIRQGRARIVIGARSAVFAPIEPLGLIIVDEEHEHSYKQDEAPRYNARDVAVMRGHMENAVVVLGSATPSMESYHNAVSGKYRLLSMPSRVDFKTMPIVRVVDMRQESRKSKGTPVFSQMLKDAIALRLERKEQVMLFLNRRGYSTSLQCPLCGYVAGCPNCSVTLTYHRSAQKLCCHVCGFEQPAPKRCPEDSCRHPGIRYAGLGTEKVEAQLGKLFPTAAVQRMDSDTLQRKEDFKRILSSFRLGKTDILIGTQMIAKGLHFPNVTLVGIIYADLSLHLPDFRAGERTFQLLTQVAGRAGRGDVEGEVVIQAFTPFHPAIQFSRRHDYEGFYDQEIEFRGQLSYPPASRIALLTFKGRNEQMVQMWSERCKSELETTLTGLSGVVLAGPAAAPLQRAETFYRYQIMLRVPHMPRVSRRLADLVSRLKLPREITMTIDIDPANLI